jgi:hypothetical protein
MSLLHSPSIVTNGLAFHYDMNNTQKSWKGAPSTNLLLYSDSMNSGLWSGYCGGTGNVTYKTTDIPAPDGSYNATKLVMDGSNGCGAGGSWGLLYGQSGIFTSGQTYTISIWARCATGTMPMSLGMNDSFGIGVTLTTTWQRFSYTTPITSNLDRGLQFIRGDSTNGRTFYVWGAQCEQNSFVTPYMSSTSVAGKRYTNNNLESSPSYPGWNQSAATASGGTLTFTSGSYNSKGTWDLYKTYSGLSTSTNYTWSALIKLGTASNLIVTMNNTSAWNTGPSEQFGGFSSTEWKRVSITGTTSTGSFNIHLGASYNTEMASVVQSGGTLLIQDVRLQLTGSQTTIQDLTGQNTIVPTSLTYASDGTFSFTGTDSSNITAQINDASTNSISRSWEAWVKPSISQTTAGLFGHVISGGCTYYCNGGVCIASGNYQFNWYDNSSYQFLDSGISATANKPVHIVGTYDSTDNKCRIYINGVLKNTGSATNMSYGGAAYSVQIGYLSASGNYFTGTINSLKYYYNKALSAEEILQNFNAMRGGYGL